MTGKLREILLSPELLSTLKGGPEEFQRNYQATTQDNTEFIANVVEQTLAMGSSAADPVWGGRLIIDDDLQTVVGTCAFKSFPVENAVEIAYFCFPQFEGRGYATAMAGSLVQVARDSGKVKCVVAHTLPEANASTRVQEKNNFGRAGEGMDDEVGRVWRWERIINN
jgi:[ribosomal protein S5]-alanine N-acetyltransferase